MMLPRPSRMVISLALAVVENSERSRISTTLPSFSLTIASESLAVRISTPSGSSWPAASTVIPVGRIS